MIIIHINQKKELLDGNIDLESKIGTTITDPNKIRAYRIAVGKERNNLYKSVAYDINYGYEIIIDDANNPNKPINSNSRSISRSNPSEVYKVDVVLSIDSIASGDLYSANKPNATMTLDIGGTTSDATIPTSSTSLRTVEFDISPSSGDKISWIFSEKELNENGAVNVYSIKVYYK